ncbi:pickpocket protein 28-like [Harmonia axyridis]|uniref:pickpocket protein 28-like n=1 Tax=Harmonia axyridis TaxID=115357 RepID=UPI001E27713E|nr:pickpocket protein 28-like [Harmonia axyridis]XP_045477141.1 pickpocket protein 28-like [Harmonia axyridis]XP_045477142.1 pickpocket protein 28-like [Harmonia axyridis]
MSKKNGENAIFKPERKYPGFRKNVSEYFAEFSNNTGIHGFKYMGEGGRTILEKIYWVSFFAVSLYFCVSLIYQTWLKWELSPVLVSFARSPTPVWRIPFPAVTVCPETKSRQRFFNYTKAYWDHLDQNITDEDLQKFHTISLVCDDFLDREGNLTTSFQSLEFLKEAAPSFQDMLWACKWTLMNETCENFFVPTLTEDGICYTFNMLDREELLTNAVFLHGDYMKHGRNSEGWTLEKGYPPNSPKDTFPRRAISAGAKAGFYLLLRLYDQDLDYVCRGPVQGFKILLHHPAAIPQVGTQYFRAPLNQEMVVSIKPDMMTTSEGLRNYDPRRRQCYFPEERQLLYYKSYTQESCNIECMSNYTYRRCGCVAYHMPHRENMDICGSGNIKCMIDARNELMSRQVNQGIHSQNQELEEMQVSDCNCLPGCTTLTYNAETSQAGFNWQKVFQSFKTNFSEFPGIQMTRLNIFFKDQQFITSERNELYGQTDFLANCGGLLGLFVGFSFLSIVEIVYFLSLRLFCNAKKFGRHYWSGSPELLENDAYIHPKSK